MLSPEDRADAVLLRTSPRLRAEAEETGGSRAPGGVMQTYRLSPGPFSLAL